MFATNPDTVLRRQVSTRLEKIAVFFQQLTEMDSNFMAILEVCGFNDWLMDTLLWTAALIAVVLVLRRPVAKWFGPHAAYALWALPVARLATPATETPPPEIKS